MKSEESIRVLERSPEAVLDFWLGRLRTAADASRENWQQGMLRWRIGPFARSIENPQFLRIQCEWCEQMHREGLDRFFRHPVWETPKGFLAKLIVLDQFPRSAYRGTVLAYENDSLTASLSRQACENDREFTHYNVIERFWIYMPLSHAEDLTLQEISLEKFARWSVDLIAEAPPNRRRINQFVSWSIIKAIIEHSEALLLFDRFPHRNAIHQRLHRGGEPQYLVDALRPLWSFTQPPDPDYFALLGALNRIGGGSGKTRITRSALTSLLCAAGLSPEDQASPMDVFDLVGDDDVPWSVLYRHLRLPEHVRTFHRLRQLPQVVDLANAVKTLILKNGEDLTWPPKSAKYSVEPAIDVAALNALVLGAEESGATASELQDGSASYNNNGGEALPEGPAEMGQGLTLVVRNDRGDLEQVAAAVDDFADRYDFPPQDGYQVQLCIEEIFMYIVEHGYDDTGTHRIEIQLEMNEGERRLAIKVINDGQELEPVSSLFQPSPDTIQEEAVVDGLGLHLVHTYVDDIRYRREHGRNHLSLSKSIGR
ncbi:MAG: DUF924 family protein [Rhodobacteraceae bacterium]|nr:DUF924 family protein [Paracoccaceae bacterium]